MNTARLLGTAAVIGSLVLALSALRPGARAQEKPAAKADESAKGGAVFKTPQGYMQAPMADFRGTMFLDPKKPGGMFVTYPTGDETLESLRERLRATLAKMFVHKDDVALTWETKRLPPHPGGSPETAAAYTTAHGDMEVQVAIYERAGGGRPFLYGHFAMRHKSRRGDDGRFLDDQGKGVKEFDELWKSFRD